METDRVQNTEAAGDDEIDLRDIFRTIWSYRFVFAVVLLIVIIGSAFFIGWVKFFPVSQVATVRFDLQFSGAQEGVYPNGIQFNTRDMLHDPNLRRVYEKNQLQDYIDFDDFRNSITVRRIENSAFLARVVDLEEQLSQENLSAADRQRIQAELDLFLNNRKPTTYRMDMQYTQALPKQTAYKILEDLLLIWAEDVVNRLNVLQYRVPLLSVEFLNRGFIENEDYFISLILIQEKYKQLTKNIQRIIQLPGGELARTSKRDISLPEIILQIQDNITYKIEPLLGLARSQGISKNKEMARVHLENRLLNLRMEQSLLQAKADIYAQNLKEYSMETAMAGSRTGSGRSDAELGRTMQDAPALTTIPQLGESFIDLIVNLAGKGQDIEFRQELVMKHIEYVEQVADVDQNISKITNLLDDLTKSSDSDEDLLSETVELFSSRFNTILDEMLSIINEVNEIYMMISGENLNPEKGLFAISLGPQIETELRMSLKKAGLLSVLLIMGTMFLTLIGVFIHAAVVSRRHS
jgi:hypothetical protein